MTTRVAGDVGNLNPVAAKARTNKWEKEIRFLEARCRRYEQIVALIAAERGLTIEQLINHYSAAQEQRTLWQLWRHVDEFCVSTRLSSILKRANIERVWEIAVRNEADLCRMKSMGRKTFRELRELLDETGLTFNMQLPQVPPPRPAGLQ